MLWEFLKSWVEKRKNVWRRCQPLILSLMLVPFIPVFNIAIIRVPPGQPSM